MKELVFKGGNNQALTNSLLVAEKFGKRHADVIRAIENLLKSGSESTNAKLRSSFVLGSYEDSKREERPLYVMNRDGFSVLAMGFTGNKAIDFKVEFTSAFNAMESQLKEQQKPISAVQMFALQANINLEHEQRLLNVEQKLDALVKEREENTTQLLSVSVAVENVPEMSLRDKVRQLVNKYSAATNINQRDIWESVYKQLYYRYHISINSYKKENERETRINVAERNGFLDKIYVIISNMVRDLKQIA